MLRVVARELRRWTINERRGRLRLPAGAPVDAKAWVRSLRLRSRQGYPCAHYKLRTGSLALEDARRVLRRRSRQEQSPKRQQTNRLARLDEDPRPATRRQGLMRLRFGRGRTDEF